MKWAGDYVWVDPDEPAAHGRIVVVRADSPGRATPVRRMAVESGRSVPRAANPGFPDIAVTCANETITSGACQGDGGRIRWTSQVPGALCAGTAGRTSSAASTR